MQPAFSLSLSRVSWNVFGTLTFTGFKEPSESHQVAASKKWLERMAVKMRMRFHEFVWCLRIERGEARGRLHLHCLLCIDDRWKTLYVVPAGKLASAVRVWSESGSRNGYAKFRLIVGEGDPALCYTLKNADTGGDTYEISKTGSSRTLLFSERAQRWMRPRSRQSSESLDTESTLAASVDE